MKVIVRPRQCGKTTDLIKLAAKLDGIIVTLKYSMVKSIEDLAKEMGMIIRTPISYKQLISENVYKPNDISTYIIDNADYILREVLNLRNDNISAIALDGVPEVDYSEVKDVEIYDELRRTNKNLTWNDFINVRYGKYDYQ